MTSDFLNFGGRTGVGPAARRGSRVRRSIIMDSARQRSSVKAGPPAHTPEEPQRILSSRSSGHRLGRKVVQWQSLIKSAVCQFFIQQCPTGGMRDYNRSNSNQLMRKRQKLRQMFIIHIKIHRNMRSKSTWNICYNQLNLGLLGKSIEKSTRNNLKTVLVLEFNENKLIIGVCWMRKES